MQLLRSRTTVQYTLVATEGQVMYMGTAMAPVEANELNSEGAETRETFRPFSSSSICIT